MPVNLPLIEKIRNKITSTPEAYNQSTWGQESEEAPCGTVACIAGWAAVLSGAFTHEEVRRNYGPDFMHVQIRGKIVLGLSSKEADVLFSGSGKKWPLRFRLLYKFSHHRAAISYLNRILRTRKVL